MKRQIVIADDHPLVRRALSDSLGQALSDTNIIACASISDVLEAVEQIHADIDLVLLDLDMPGVGGLAGLTLLQSTHPLLPVAILSATVDADHVHRALSAGASGYLSKSMELTEMVSAITEILAGEIWTPSYLCKSPKSESEYLGDSLFRSLSQQQKRIVIMIVEGRMNKEIAGELGIAEQTVKTYISNIFRKLGVTRRTQLAVLASDYFNLKG